MYLYSVGMPLSNLCTYCLMTEGPMLIVFFLPICFIGFYKSVLFDFVSFVMLRSTRVEIALSAFDRLYH